MGIPYEEMRSYIWELGWRPFKMIEQGREVLAWRIEKFDRECQDIEQAYTVSKFNVEVRRTWTT